MRQRTNDDKSFKSSRAKSLSPKKSPRHGMTSDDYFELEEQKTSLLSNNSKCKSSSFSSLLQKFSSSSSKLKSHKSKNRLNMKNNSKTSISSSKFFTSPLFVTVSAMARG